jgi:hypothetical protein
MRNRVSAAFIALALSMSHIASAHAFVLGWNFLRAYNCVGFESGGANYLYIYPTTGGLLFTMDAVSISLLAPLCASGDGFFIYNTGTAWTQVSI